MVTRHIAVSAGGVRGQGTKPVGRVRTAHTTFDIKPGEIRKGVAIPCEVLRTSQTTLRITNTDDAAIQVGLDSVEPGKSIVPSPQVWTKVSA